VGACSRNTTVVAVAVFAPLRQTFDYSIAVEPAVAAGLEGYRALVPFGRSTRVGIILGRKRFSDFDSSRLKSVIRLLDDVPLLRTESLNLARWAADYYHHPLGEVVAGMLPTRLRRNGSVPREKHETWRLTSAGEEAFRGLKSSARRQKQVLELLQRHRCTPESFAGLGFVWRPVLRRLLSKGWIEEVDIPAVTSEVSSLPSSVVLNSEQECAAKEIADSLGAFKTVVVQGVTGSGKTEVYLDVIKRCLHDGKQSLVLVPEIGLTQQLVQRFKARFGPRIGVMHSGLTDSERVLTWLQCWRGEVGVLIGTRSAVWVPLPRLGLIVVDEEHDQSYKQHEGFRYSARDIATVRAQHTGIPVVLGSATPSLETLANVRRGKYAHTVITSRPRDIPMPQISCLDVRGMPLTAGLSETLIDAIRTHLDNGAQVILFLNRRGYSPLLICRNCGEPQRCDKCDAYLVYHKAIHAARCHHCDKQWFMNRPARCCPDPEIANIGLGTERIEEAIKELFPQHRVRRIDRDSVRRKGFFDEVLTEVAERRVDILIGTQMLAKGFDFSDVTLVGVVDADSRLYSVDFRAEERLAQLLIQVAGRAGRTTSPGLVLVQTHHPHHPVLRQIIEEGYEAYANTALHQRKEAGLPPYSAMTIVRAESGKPSGALDFLGLVRNVLTREADGQLEVSYPIPALMERRAGRYRALIVIRASGRAHSSQLLSDHLSDIEELARGARVRWSLDVDPQDTL
jgi:primosomal protein N' (replication factor Y) (superfamily II helicase)